MRHTTLLLVVKPKGGGRGGKGILLDHLRAVETPRVHLGGTSVVIQEQPVTVGGVKEGWLGVLR